MGKFSKLGGEIRFKEKYSRDKKLTEAQLKIVKEIDETAFRIANMDIGLTNNATMLRPH